MLQPLVLAVNTRNLAVPVRLQQVTIDPKTFLEFAESQRTLKGIASTLDEEAQAKKDVELLEDAPEVLSIAEKSAIRINITSYEGKGATCSVDYYILCSRCSVFD